jgi:hypothetical protein
VRGIAADEIGLPTRKEGLDRSASRVSGRSVSFWNRYIAKIPAHPAATPAA